MTPTEVAKWLQAMWDNNPSPDSGEEAYRWLHSRVERVVRDGREELLGRLRVWLSLRADQKTIVSAKLEADFHSTELRPDLLLLLDNIERGQTGFPAGRKIYYANLFADYLSRI